MSAILLAAHLAFAVMDKVARAIGWLSIVVCLGTMLLAFCYPRLISEEEPNA